MTLCVTYRVAPITDGGFCDLVSALTTLRYHYLSKIYFPIKYGGRLWSRVRHRNGNDKSTYALPLLENGNSTTAEGDSLLGCCNGLLSRSRCSRSASSSGNECHFRRMELAPLPLNVKKKQNKKRKGFRISPNVPREKNHGHGERNSRVVTIVKNECRRSCKGRGRHFEYRFENESGSWRESKSIYVSFFKSQQNLALEADDTDGTSGDISKIKYQLSANDKTSRPNHEENENDNRGIDEGKTEGINQRDQITEEEKTVDCHKIASPTPSDADITTAGLNAVKKSTTHREMHKASGTSTDERISNNPAGKTFDDEKDHSSECNACDPADRTRIASGSEIKGSVIDILEIPSSSSADAFTEANTIISEVISPQINNNNRPLAENGLVQSNDSLTKDSNSRTTANECMKEKQETTLKISKEAKGKTDDWHFIAAGNSVSQHFENMEQEGKGGGELNLEKRDKTHHLEPSKQIMGAESSSHLHFDDLGSQSCLKSSDQSTKCLSVNSESEFFQEKRTKQRHSFDSSSTKLSESSSISDEWESTDYKFPSLSKFFSTSQLLNEPRSVKQGFSYANRKDEIHRMSEFSDELPLLLPPSDRVYGQWQAKLMEESEGDDVDFKMFQRMAKLRVRSRKRNKKTFFEKLGGGHDYDDERNSREKLDKNANIEGFSGQKSRLNAFPIAREKHPVRSGTKLWRKDMRKNLLLKRVTEEELSELVNKTDSDDHSNAAEKTEKNVDDKIAENDSLFRDCRAKPVKRDRTKSRENKKRNSGGHKNVGNILTGMDDKTDKVSSRSGRAPPNFDMWGFLGVRNKNEADYSKETKGKKIDKSKNAEQLVIKEENKIEFVIPQGARPPDDTSALLLSDIEKLETILSPNTRDVMKNNREQKTKDRVMKFMKIYKSDKIFRHKLAVSEFGSGVSQEQRSSKNSKEIKIVRNGRDSKRVDKRIVPGRQRVVTKKPTPLRQPLVDSDDEKSSVTEKADDDTEKDGLKDVSCFFC